MANYTALDSYSMFMPPSDNLLFRSYAPQNMKYADDDYSPAPIPVQPSPAPSSPEVVGSESPNEADAYSPNFFNYSPQAQPVPSAQSKMKSNPVKDDDWHKKGAVAPSPVSESPSSPEESPQSNYEIESASPDSPSESQAESPSPSESKQIIADHSASPAMSQMYSMRRK